MSQGSVIIPTSGVVSGVTMATDINTALDALRSSNSGGSAPGTDSPIGGQLWWDTSVTPPVLRIFDGSDWLVAQGQTFYYDTVADVIAATVPDTINFLLVAGYTTPGDLGGALYWRNEDPFGEFQSADGAWWLLKEPIVNPYMFGAIGDGSADDTTGSQACVSYCVALGIPMICPGGAFRSTSAIVVDGRISMQGAGSAVSQFFIDPTIDDTSMTFTENANGSRVVGFGFTGYQAVGATAPAVWIQPGCNNMHFEHNFIQGGECCLHQQGTDNTFFNNEMRFAYGRAIVVNYGDAAHSSGVWFIRNKLDHASSNNEPPAGYVANARADTTHYDVDDVVTNQGWLIQCTTAGTTGSGDPTFTTYENPFADGSAAWQLMCPIGYASMLIDSGSSELFLDNNDHSGFFDVGINIVDNQTGGAPYLIHISHAICGNQHQQAINVGAGKDVYIGQGCELNPGWAESDAECVATQGSFTGNIHVCDCDIMSGNSNVDALKFFGNYNGVTVADNYFKGTFSHGIKVDTGGGAIECLSITGNNFEESNSINVDSGANWYVITSNQTKGGGVSAATSASKVVANNV